MEARASKYFEVSHLLLAQWQRIVAQQQQHHSALSLGQHAIRNELRDDLVVRDAESLNACTLGYS